MSKPLTRKQISNPLPKVPRAAGEEWFVQFKARGVVFAAMIEEVTAKTYVLRRLPDGLQLVPLDWMLIRVLHKDVKLVEPILGPIGHATC